MDSDSISSDDSKSDTSDSPESSSFGDDRRRKSKGKSSGHRDVNIKEKQLEKKRKRESSGKDDGVRRASSKRKERAHDVERSSVSFEFELVKKLGKNCWECMTYLDGGAGERRCVVSYRNSNKARKYIDQLHLLTGCPFICKGFTSCNDNDNLVRRGESGSLAFVEPLTTLEHWLNKPDKKMWSYKKGVCVGFGKDFRRVFYQIAMALEAMGVAGIPHGNVNNEGVMFGLDGNVRLSNFLLEDDSEAPGVNAETMLVKKLERDLFDFRELLGYVVRRHPPTHPYPKGVDNHIELFYQLYGYALVHDNHSEFISVARWIYRGPIVWNSEKVGLLLKKVNSVLDGSERTLQDIDFLPDFYDWRSKLRKHGTKDMINCLDFKKKGKIYATKMYAEPFGVIRFTRNYQAHPGKPITPEAALEEVLTVFPNLPGAIYRDIFLFLRNMRLAETPREELQDIRRPSNINLDPWNLRMPETSDKIQEDLPDKTFGAYLCKRPSIFDLEDPADESSEGE